MKKKVIVAIVLCVIALTSIFAFAGCDRSTDGANLEGFDIELAKLVAKDLGVEARFLFIKWEAKEIELKNKSIDLIWNGLTINEGRLEQFCISKPYMNNKQIAVIRKSDSEKYTNLENIKDAKFAYEKGSEGQTAAEKNNFANRTGLDAQVDALTEVKSGTSDIAILDSVLGNFYCSEDTSYSSLMVIPNFSFSVEQYGIAARKSDVGTIDKINTSLAKLQANGELAKLADKYGLKSELCDMSYESKWDTLSDEEKAGWNYIVEKGSFVVGYTLYAPIAYEV